MPSSKGGRHTNFSYKQTDRTKTTCLPERGGDIQTLVTNRTKTTCLPQSGEDMIITRVQKVDVK